jgi:hypothetical protein
MQHDPPAPSTSNSEAAQYIHVNSATSGRYSQIHTVNQAKEEVHRLFDDQLTKATAERPSPNESTHGDARAREAFWTLLAPEEQRDMFMTFWKRRAFWPRIKPLVGTPPFSFLRPGDNHILNASGIAPGRTNMSHSSDNPILSSSEIGGGHVSDQHGRLYKVLKTDVKLSENVVFRRIASSGKVAMDCKLPRMGMSDRATIYKRRGRDPESLHKIQFPRIGEELTLQLVNALLDTASSSAAPPHRMVVKGVIPRDKSSPVCRVFAEAVRR